MGNGKTYKDSISAEQLHKLSQGVNRENAKSQGFYDGRFAPKTEPSKKRTGYLRLRRQKPVL